MNKKTINIILIMCSIALIGNLNITRAKASETTNIGSNNNMTHTSPPTDNTGNTNTNNGDKSTNKNPPQSGGSGGYTYPLGSVTNPIPIYLTGNCINDHKAMSLHASANAAWNNGKPKSNEKITIPAYGKTNAVFLGDDGEYYKYYHPTYIISKNEKFNDIKIGYTVDKYKWRLSDGVLSNTNWDSRERETPTKSTSITFSRVGTYTINVMPHEVTTRQKWTDYNNSYYILYSNGATKWLDSNKSSSAKETYTVQKWRTDLTERKVFKISPEEVGVPIDPSTNGETLAEPEVEGFLIE